MRGIRHRLITYGKRFNRVAWLLIIGEFLEATGRYMVQPFLALYLNHLDVDLGIIGLVLAAGPIATLGIGIIGGTFADTIGRRPLLIGSTVLASIALIGFGTTSNVIAFAILNFVNTAARSLYRPANFAALADVTTPEQRMEAFGLRRVSLNIGAAIGPFLGYLLAQIAPQAGFIAAGLLNLGLGGFMMLFIPETRPHHEVEQQDLGRSAWSIILHDPALWLFIVCTACFSGASRMIDSYLPLAMVGHLPEWIVPTIIAINAIMVVVLQLPINRSLNGRNLGMMLFVGGLLYALAWFGFAYSLRLINVIIMVVILTFGELISAAATGIFVAKIAPAHLRGRYEAVANFREVGRSLIPAFAGFIMSDYGASWLFSLIGIIMIGAAVVGKYADAWADKRHHKLTRI